MTRASGTRRGSALSTPSTSVQMWISEAFSRSPRIDAEKSLPLRPRVVWMPCGSRAMNPGTISVVAASALTTCDALAREASQRTAGPRCPHSHLDHVARVHPADAGPPAARHQGPREQPRGPQLPEPDHEIARGGRGRPRQPHRLQQGGDILAIRVERARIGPGLGFRAQGRGHVHVPGPQRRQRLPGVFLPLRRRDQGQQRVRDAPARRQHHGQASRRLALDDGRHVLHAGGVGHARAAEFEDPPGVADRLCGPELVHI